jgi:hypothetical protein
MTTPEKPKLGIWKSIFNVAGCILLIPWVIVVLLGFAVYALLMVMAVRVVCIFRGRYIIFIHSNSPVWQDYIAANILPRLPADTVILNWSDHLTWRRFSFPVRVFSFYGHHAEFNPMGLVGTALRGVKTFRFWQPFRDFKHGNDRSLKDMEASFFAYLDGTRRTINE